MVMQLLMFTFVPVKMVERLLLQVCKRKYGNDINDHLRYGAERIQNETTEQSI